MKYTFVGDIHGKVECVEKALDMDGQVVFVGDFMDSFDRPPEDHRKCLRLVLDAIKAGKARAIYGNHELSYMQDSHRCSGWNGECFQIMMEARDELEEYFEPHILLTPDLLVTHAGLTRQIWNTKKLSMGMIDDVLWGWWLDLESPVHRIGHYRGGRSPVGGTFWCDFNTEFKPVPGLWQVFGHTSCGGKQGVRQIGTSYCIDCLNHVQEFLTLEV